MKRCCRCHVTKPISEFWIRRRAKDGLFASCKACESNEEQKAKQRIATAKWLAKPGNHKKHLVAVKLCRQAPKAKETHRQRQLVYAACNREQERQRAANWRDSNPERDVESHRSYYLRNGDEVRAKSKAYRLEHPEEYKEYNLQYRHALRAGGGRMSKGYSKRLMIEQNGMCNACKCDLSISGHELDHIVPISKGGPHCDANVQLLCPPCNRRKSAKSFEDFLNLLTRTK
jgi:5-methylcytosine-specific restriction endonuclease McrA